MIDKRNHYINGAWVATQGGADAPVYNPATEEPYATISLGSAADAEAAMEHAISSLACGRRNAEAE